MPAKLALLAVLAAATPAPAAAAPAAPIVHSAFGGQIFGFDIDQNGPLGILSEAKPLGGSKLLAAIETFDQATGKIVAVVSKIEAEDDFLTLGIAGTGVGLVEREHAPKLYVTRRVYDEINPLSAGKITAKWSAPLSADDIIIGFSWAQGVTNNAVLAYHNKGAGRTFLFGANIAANTNGKLITLHDPAFGICCGPVVAYDDVTNQALVASSTGAVGGPPPVFVLADLATGHTLQFRGLPGPPPFRAGSINGLAIDAQDNIAVTTTELDFSLEFYDLKTKAGFAVTLPGASSQLQSGADVEYDAVHKLFFVAQPVSSTAPSGSSIQVFDTKGNLVESLNGFAFSNGSNVAFTHIALNPAARTGYVDGPSPGVTTLQSFTY